MLANFLKGEVEKSSFSKRMEVLIEKLKDKKVIIYGFGEETGLFLNKYNFKSLNIIAVSDTWLRGNNSFEGYPAVSCWDISKNDYDYILIVRDNFKRAKKHLVEKVKLPEEKIIDVSRTELPDEEVYFEFLKNISFEKRLKELSKKLKNKKIVVYGANSFFETIVKNYDLSDLNIIAVTDMKFKMQKEIGKFYSWDTYPTFKIENLDFDCVLVALKDDYNEIAELLRFTTLRNMNKLIMPICHQGLSKEAIKILNQKNVNSERKLTFFTKAKRILNFASSITNGKINHNTYAPYTIPTTIRLEASTLCQLKCKSCYMRTQDHSAVGDGNLKFKDYKKFIDETPYIKEVSLSNSGEIFMNPELGDIIKYSYEKGVKLNAFTGVNLNYLPDEIAEALVKYKFSYMILSIDGASQETYSQYRVGGNFDRVIENVKKINYYKKLYNSEFPKMTWKFILFNHNDFEVVKAKEMAKELNMEIAFAFPWGVNTYQPKDPEFIKKETGLKFASMNEKEKTTKKNYVHNLCERVFSAPQFNFDGSLLACCMLYKEHYGINLFEVGYENALNSAEFQYSVRMLRGEIFPVDCNPCTYCTEYVKFSYNDIYYNI